MKNININSERLVITSIFLILISGQLFSQGTDSRTLLSKQKKVYLGALVNFSSTSINCQNYLNLGMPGTKGEMSAGAIIDFAWFFKSFAGINIGAGLSSYSQTLVLDSYETSFTETDSENETYEMQIRGKSIVEEQKISELIFPVSIILRMQMTERLGFFIKGGMQCEIPVVKSFKGSGLFTYNGYYETYPVLLHDLPEYGFPSDLDTKATGHLTMKSFTMSMTASGGISMDLGQKIQLILSAGLSKSMSDISGRPDANYRMTSAANEYRSIMESSVKPRLKALGFGLGLRYFLDKPE